jgi:hypothetical protein
MQRIKSFGVLSVAKISGLCYAAMGLLLIPFFLLLGLIGALAPKQQGMPALGAAFGVVLAVCMPIIYGVMGFVMGALGAFIYNLISGWIGGIEIELQPVIAAAVSVPVNNS